MKQNILKNKGQKLRLTTLGFTLIELLAVIVILAIIALIATPIILGIIKDAKEQANQRSVDNYAKALKFSISKYQVGGEKLNINTLDVKKESNGSKFNNTNLEVDYEGNVVCSIIEIYVNGDIYLAQCKVNGVNVDYTYGKDQSYDNGQAVYFDVIKGTGCTKKEYEKSFDENIEDYLNSSTGYNGYKKENDNSKKNSCLKFYAFNDNFGETINLLLDHTITTRVAWNSSKSNILGPKEVLEQLKADTSVWNGTQTPTTYTSKTRGYIINYEGYKARLIGAQEIAQITGANKAPLYWKEEVSVDWYYLDGAKGTDDRWTTTIANSKNKSEYHWLFDRNSGCEAHGCLIGESYDPDVYTPGYWTSTAHKFEKEAWVIDFGAGIGHTNLGSADGDYGNYGVRPVIEVLKSKLK